MTSDQCQLKPRNVTTSILAVLVVITICSPGCPETPTSPAHPSVEVSAGESSQPLSPTVAPPSPEIGGQGSTTRIGLVIWVSGLLPDASGAAEAKVLRRRLSLAVVEALAGVVQVVDLAADRAGAAVAFLDASSPVAAAAASSAWLQGTAARRLDGVVVVMVEAGVAETVRARAVTRLPLVAGEAVELVARRSSDLEAVVLAAFWQVLPIGARVLAVEGDLAELGLEGPPAHLARFQGPSPLVFALSAGPGASSSVVYVVVTGNRLDGAGEVLIGRVVALPSQPARVDGRAYRLRLGVGARPLEVREEQSLAAVAGLAVWAGDGFEALSFRGVTDAEGRFDLVFQRPEPLAVIIRRTVGETPVDLARRVVVAGVDPLRLTVRSDGRLLAELVQSVAQRERLLGAVRAAVADGLGDIYEGRVEAAEKCLGLAERNLEALGETSVGADLVRQLEALRSAVARAGRDRRARQLAARAEQLMGALRYDEALRVFDEATRQSGSAAELIARRREAREIADEREAPRGVARARIQTASTQTGDTPLADKDLDDLAVAIDELSTSTRPLDQHLLDQLAERLDADFAKLEKQLETETSALARQAATAGRGKALEDARRRVQVVKKRGEELLLLREKIDEALRTMGGRG